jgi:hypothetical protein
LKKAHHGHCEEREGVTALIELNLNYIVYVAAASVAVLLAVTAFLKLRR